MLELRKKGDKYWLFEDSEIGLFSPSKFTINLELNDIIIVYENGLKSKRYNVSDCEIYDLGATSPFTTSSGNAFMEELENLNCPCFQKNENIFNISGGAWGDITGNLSNQTDLQTALDSKLNKDTTAGVERAYIINADGSQGTKATSEFKDVLEFADFDAFPTTGETEKIYVALDTNKTYRWSGSAYVQIGGGGENYLFKSWVSLCARKEAAGLVATNMNLSIFAASGTSTRRDIFPAGWWFNNYLSATTPGAIAGVRQQNVSESTISSGFDSYFIFAPNDTNINAQTIVGFTSLVADFPNVDFSAYTGAMQIIGNDVGDANLSFYVKTNAYAPEGIPASFTKIPLDSNFPAHSTNAIYLFRIEAPRTDLRVERFIKMTITNLITGVTATHTFDSSFCPQVSSAQCFKCQKSARNSGVATNIGLHKYYFQNKLY